MKDGGQSGGIGWTDAGDGQTTLIVGLPRQLSNQPLDAPINTINEFLDLGNQCLD